MGAQERHVYDCDTYNYWCSEEDYNDRDRRFGSFIEDGRAYEITDKNTPRPWLNYLSNRRVCAAFSNTGLGFMWYKTSLLRITKYDHPIDYQPREFRDGREIFLQDADTGIEWNAFRDAADVHCIHRPGYSVIDAEHNGIRVELVFFVPREDACECWQVNIRNTGTKTRRLKVGFGQTWVFARFGIHTAEYGIPYLSTPGERIEVTQRDNAILAHTDDPKLPVELWGCFCSPQCSKTSVTYDVEKRRDGRTFRFPVCTLSTEISLEAGADKNFDVISGVEEDNALFEEMVGKYAGRAAFSAELEKVKRFWERLEEYPSCELPDKNMRNFLNVWLKNQLFTTFRYVRSGYIGYRDTLQDTWGYQLVERELTKEQILRTLAFMKKDGSCPRNYSPFGYGDKNDLRNNMDSGTWIAACIAGYIKETGDAGILQERIRYFDDEKLYTVEEHIWAAYDLLFTMRGQKGFNLVIDGDWNDALEGISKHGPAVSVWVTIATYNGQNILADMYEHLGEPDKAKILRERSEILERVINENAWDGEWYIYAITGNGNPVGSHVNKGGKIHLNSNTWAVLSGVAKGERAKKTMESIRKYLDTPIGPALLYPPYELDEGEVGRIINLEPGTFENGSVYQHAVAFKIFADIAYGDYEQAYKTFVNVLPTNPYNFDARRTSEPYCTGNYYCGPTHKRFGQNFFTWFTGNPAWLLRAGFDEILGVRAGYDGLEIEPKVPASWDGYSVKREYRGTRYDIRFIRSSGEKYIIADGRRIDGNVIPACEKPEVKVEVYY